MPRAAWRRFVGGGWHPAVVRTAYRCRAYPDAAQQQVLARTFGCVRVVWNRTLAERRRRWQQERRGTSYAETDAALTVLKKDPELAWLNEVSCVPLQQALRHQQQAFAAFFGRRARYPRFRSRHGRQSAHYTRSAFSMRDGELRLAKMAGPLAFVWSWPEANVGVLDPTMVIVSREPDGRWYVTFGVDACEPEPLPAAGRSVGIDLGVTSLLVMSDGRKIANPRHLERRARGLARYQRRLARCQQGSANRAKARAKVARAHRKARNARRDFLHRTTTGLVRGHDTGMWIGYALAADHPDRVDRLAVAEAAMPGVSASPPLFGSTQANNQLWHFPFNRLAEVNNQLAAGREDIYFGFQFAKAANKLPEHVVRYYVDALSDPDALNGSFQAYRALDTTIAQNEQRKARRLTLPVLAIGGAAGIGEGAANTMKLAADNVHSVVIPGCGHYCLEEAPEEILKALTEFLAPYRDGSAVG